MDDSFRYNEDGVRLCVIGSHMNDHPMIQIHIAGWDAVLKKRLAWVCFVVINPRVRVELGFCVT